MCALLLWFCVCTPCFVGSGMGRPFLLLFIFQKVKAIVNHASVNKKTKAVVDHASVVKTTCDMSRFLLTCRQWKVFPTCRRQDQAEARFEGQDGDTCDQIVSRIDFTVHLLCLLLFETQTLSMT